MELLDFITILKPFFTALWDLEFKVKIPTPIKLSTLSPCFINVVLQYKIEHTEEHDLAKLKDLHKSRIGIFMAKKECF